MQNRKRDTDVQSRILDSMGEGEGGMFERTALKHVYMKFKKMVMITLYVKQKKRHRCTE